MKKYLLLLLPFLFTITAYSQNGYSSVFLRVTDSATFVNSANTVAKHAADYADIWYSVNSGLFWKWSTVTNTYTQLASGSGWPLTGTANFTGDVTIDNGVHNLIIGDIAGPYWYLDIDGSGPLSFANSTIQGVGDPTSSTHAFVQQAVSNDDNGVFMSASDPATGSANITVNAGLTTQISLQTSGLLDFRSGSAQRLIIQADGSWDLAGTTPGSSGNVLTSNGAGAAPTWQAAGGGGVSGLTATRVPFAASSTTLSDDADFLFTGGNLLTTPLIKITSGSPGANKVLTSDADGDGTWNATADISTAPIAGDVTGTIGATVVAKIQGINVSTTDPTDGEVLIYDTGTSMYVPGPQTGGGGGGCTWTDWSGSLSPTGFSSTSSIISGYCDDGVMVTFYFNVTGTSNSTAATFTMPVAPHASYSTSGIFEPCYTATTVATVGMIAVSGGSTTATLYTGPTATGWTNAVNKSYRGTITYRK